MSQSMGQSPAVLSWGSEENAHFYISTLTTVMEPLVPFPRSYPCSEEDCTRRSGASRAVINSLCWALMKLYLEHVSGVGSPDKEGMDVLERAQGRAMNAREGLEHLPL